MTTIITPKLFAARRELCVRAGLRTMTYEEAQADSAARAGRPDFERTRVHEVSHDGAYLDRSVRFHEVFVRADGTGALSTGTPPSGSIPPDRMRPLDTAVACEIAGCVGEMVLLGSVSPWEVMTDVTRAWMRADGDPHLVREQVRRLTKTFSDHRGALRHMANELRRAGRLDRARCVELAHAAGWHVDSEPKFEPTTSPEERKRMDAIKARWRDSAQNPKADADADAEAKSEEARALIRDDPRKYRLLWTERERARDPQISDETIEQSWQKFCDHIGLAIPEASP